MEDRSAALEVGLVLSLDQMLSEEMDWLSDGLIKSWVRLAECQAKPDQ